MRDYVREMMETWTADGDQAAYDLGGKLLAEIDVDVNSLRTQATAIAALSQHLQDVGVKARAKSTLDTVRPSERPRLILDAAVELWRQLPEDNDLIKVQDVLHELNTKGLDLGVKQPLAVIGTVLTNAEQFTKVARNTFEYNREPAF